MSLSNIQSIIIGQALMVAREIAVMPRLVNLDYAAELSAYGKEIDLVFASDVPVRSVAPGVVPPAASYATPTTVKMQLNKLFEAPFALTDTDVSGIQQEKMYIPRQLEKASQAMANHIDKDILLDYRDVYNCDKYANSTTGAITGDPFGTSTVEAANAGRVLTSKGKVPMDERQMLLHPIPYYNLVGLPAMQKVNETGMADALRMGRIEAPVLGFNIYQSQNVLFHTAGTLNAGSGNRNPLVNGALLKGATTMNIDATTLTGTVVRGDIFTITGVNTPDDNTLQHFTVTNTSTLTAGSNAIAGITFQPPLPVAVADDTATTFYGSHRVNLAFHRDAFGMVIRFLDRSYGGTIPRQITQMGDPISGLLLTYEIMPQYYQNTHAISCFWGNRCVRPEFACRVIGAT